jgi:hypothetical protein
MNTALVIALLTVLGSGVSAGIVTFCMSFWKAELDFRRAKIEELYAAVHKYTKEMAIQSLKTRTGRAAFAEEAETVFEDSDRISLLLDLYFPRLVPTFGEYRRAIEKFLVLHGKFRNDDEALSEEYLQICKLGDRLKAEVVELSRQYSLRALLEAVQDQDRGSLRR